MIKQLIEQRNTLVAQAGAIAENKDATKEQRTQVKAMFVTIDEIQEKIDIAKRMEILNDEVRASGMPPRGQPGADFSNDAKENQALEIRAFENWMKGTIKPEERKYLRTEDRAVTIGAPGATTGGGVLVPVGIDPILHISTKNIGELLSAVRVWQSDSSEGIRVSLANDTNQSGSIAGENTAITEADPAFGGMTSYVDQWNSGLLTVSNPLLISSFFDVQGFISDSITTRFARYANTAITNGNSSNVASIIAGATTVTAATGTTTALDYKSLLKIFENLDHSYLANASWVCSTATWISMLGITDTLGRPLITSDLQGNPFRSLLGRPILVSEAMPAVEAGSVPLLLGDMRQGYTARLGSLAIRKSVDRFFEDNATVFAAWAPIGGYSTAAGGPNPIVSLTMASA